MYMKVLNFCSDKSLYLPSSIFLMNDAKGECASNRKNVLING
jgi:hypothetical protein